MKLVKIFAAAIVAAASAFAFPAKAQNNTEYHLKGMTVERTAQNQLKVSVAVHPEEYRLRTNQRIEVTPVVRSLTSNDSIVLPSFTIAGRNSYYSLERDGKYPGTLMRSGKGEVFNYEALIPWEGWMEYSKMELLDRSTGCCGVPTSPLKELPVVELDFRPETFSPRFHYKAPKVDTEKTNRIEGKAYVNFPVNRTEIYIDYMVNPVELRKILNSIDSVRINPDATVKAITLTGFASPEGPYKNNERLAAGRTEAVKEYVRKQYTFPASVFHTNSIAEDWAGLRDSVVNSVLPDRVEILDFIDNGNVPIERRNDELKKRFPSSYNYLLKNIYPSLRHTNYAIDYELRTFTDVEEIKRVMQERPKNLSLHEFFIAANSYPVGSEDYDRVFELAAIYFPTNDIANLNAANSAMNRGDYAHARTLLKRVKDSPEAQYALAVLMALEGDYENARPAMQKAKDAGVPEAKQALDEIDRIRSKGDNIKFYPEFNK